MKRKQRRAARRAVDVLNRALAADHDAIADVVNHRVGCNAALRDDPSIQVGPPLRGHAGQVGLVGILNGVLGTNAEGHGLIGVWVEDGEIIRFELNEGTA